MTYFTKIVFFLLTNVCWSEQTHALLINKNAFKIQPQWNIPSRPHYLPFPCLFRISEYFPICPKVTEDKYVPKLLLVK